MAGRVGGSAAPLSGEWLGWGVGELGMTVKMAGADTPHLQCSWHPNGWGVFLGPVVKPSGLRGASSFDEVTGGHAVLMRSARVVQL